MVIAPKGTSLLGNTSFEPGRRIEKKGRDRTGQNSQKLAKYFTYTWGEATTEPIFATICTVVAVPDLITCANF